MLKVIRIILSIPGIICGVPMLFWALNDMGISNSFGQTVNTWSDGVQITLFFFVVVATIASGSIVLFLKTAALGLQVVPFPLNLVTCCVFPILYFMVFLGLNPIINGIYAFKLIAS